MVSREIPTVSHWFQDGLACHSLVKEAMGLSFFAMPIHQVFHATNRMTFSHYPIFVCMLHESSCLQDTTRKFPSRICSQDAQSSGLG